MKSFHDWSQAIYCPFKKTSFISKKQVVLGIVSREKLRQRKYFEQKKILKLADKCFNGRVWNSHIRSRV